MHGTPTHSLNLANLDRQRASRASRSRWDRIPASVQHALTNYFEHRLDPGGCVRAILAGSLFAACRLADAETKRAIFDIAEEVSFNAPLGSYGSTEAVDEWLAGRVVV